MDPRLAVRAGLACSLATAVFVTAPSAQEPAAPPPANYVVHEWGTFTSMAGTDGFVLEGLHHEEEHLPKFVHDLARIAEFARVDGEKLPASRVTQKMETPVIYFYADEPMSAQVHVWFQKGVMTQFYPLPHTVTPELSVLQKARLDVSGIDWSSLVWDVDVIPRTMPAPAGIPEVAADDPWHFARQTQASYVRTRIGADSPAKSEAEHYLFYRGLGRWQPEVRATTSDDGVTHFENRMGHAIPFSLALELTEAGGRFVVGGAVAPGAEVAPALAAARLEPDREIFARTVGAVVMKALVDQGLYLDEARAMVATWSRSWFQRDGARIVYLLPREQVDAVLYLGLSPRPKEVVRVLVGRLEFITPALQQRVEHALRERGNADPGIAARGAAVLARLDRFLEPHLRNVARCGKDSLARGAATAMLASKGN